MTDIASLLRPIRGCATDEQYRDVWDRVEAALLAASPSPWRDMESAPKDGTIIILGRPETEDGIALSVPGHWQHAFEDGVDYMGNDGGFIDIGLTWFRPGRSFGTESSRYPAVQPTGWQPLPEPPSEGEK